LPGFRYWAVFLPTTGAWARPSAIRTVAQEAERLGFGGLMMRDHINFPHRLHQGHSPMPVASIIVEEEGRQRERDILDEEAKLPNLYESMTTMSFLAGVTEKVEIGVVIILLALRNPILLAKQIACLDQLSGGRVVIGLGTGNVDHVNEWVLMGAPYEHRGPVTDEYIRVMKEIWTRPNASYNGRYIKFSDSAIYPKPLRKPHPPLWIGGLGDRVLKRVAELGDGWTPAPPLVPEELAARVDSLKEKAKLHGRGNVDFQIAPEVQIILDRQERVAKWKMAQTVEGNRTWAERYHHSLEEYSQRFLCGTPSQILKGCEEYVEAGATHPWIYFNYLTVEDLLDQMTLFAKEVLPSF